MRTIANFFRDLWNTILGKPLDGYDVEERWREAMRLAQMERRDAKDNR